MRESLPTAPGLSGTAAQRPALPALHGCWPCNRAFRDQNSRRRTRSFILLGLLLLAGLSPATLAQPRPSIGYVYPAGGQRGTTFQVKLGGQGLDDVSDVLVTGPGVSARVVEYYRRLNPQEIQLLNEQLRELRKATSAVAIAAADLPVAAAPKLMAQIDRRLQEYVQTPACASIAALVFAEITIAPEADPGARELRLATPRGISNPLTFQVGQLPEYTRKPMITARIQVLGKEASALRTRPAAEAEEQIAIPCTVNGQIASGEVNRYRFTARRGQRLVLATQARQLIPFIADAVPGWFQPVLSVHDAAGRELAYADDDRFKPDPVLRFTVPRDGDYVVAIADALYRGREDFIYRVTLGEVPFVTSVFPLGAPAGTAAAPKLSGWNLEESVLASPPKEAPPGLHALRAVRPGIVSNPVPFELDELPEALEQEPNDSPAGAQSVTLPVILNGRIDRPGDADVFRFNGRSNATLVAEVTARRLDSPLDSVLRLTDESGRGIAFNDDREDLGAGLHTHHADSWLLATLPADGAYCVHLGDTARHGGEEYGYRLRLSGPRADFVLRVVPSSVSLRTNASATVTVYAQRQDGFARSIQLTLKDPPAGFSAVPVRLAAGQNSARFRIQGPAMPTTTPVNLTIVGTALVGGKPIVRAAVPAEDRMQAFLWRQLVPARELKALVFDPSSEPTPRRRAPRRTTPAPPAAKTNVVASTNAPAGTNIVTGVPPKFNRSQVARRLRELKLLYEEGLLTEAFYHAKADECEALQ